MAMCLIANFTFTAIAQSPSPPPLIFRSFGTEEGLPQNAVPCMLQDRFGFLWFGTQDGLARFDGYGFTTFRHNPNDPQTLSDSDIRTLLEDKAGNLWIGTGNGGLNRLNRATGKITRFQHNPNEAKSLSHNEVWTLLQDRTGTIWVGTRGGLNRFNCATQSFSHFRHNPSLPTSLSDDIVLSLLEDKQGMLWVGTGVGGLNAFNPATGVFTRFLHDVANPRSLSCNRFVKTMLEDRTGMIWIGTEEGLNRLDRRTGTFTRFLHDAANPRSLSNNAVLSLWEDRAGMLWIGTEQGMDVVLDRMNGVFATYFQNPASSKDLRNDRILSLWEDNSFRTQSVNSNSAQTGVLWIGTRGGLHCIERVGAMFTGYAHSPTDGRSLSNNEVWAILEERTNITNASNIDKASNNTASNDAAVWIGTRNGLNRFDRRTGVFTRFLNDLKNPRSLSDNEVWSLLQDRTGTLWAGTRNGLCCLHKGEWRRYAHNPLDSTSLSNSGIFSLFEDSRGGIWVGTGKGANLLDPAMGKCRRFQHNPLDSTSLAGDVVNAFFEDTEGNIWIGTRGGLSLLNRTTGRFRRFCHKDGDNTSLSSNIVSSLLQDPTNPDILLVGTLGGGVNRLNRKTGKAVAVRERDGLPNETVYGMVADDNSNIWLTTNKGLCKVRLHPHQDSNAQVLAVYDKRYGLRDNEFSSGAYHKGASGRVYVGGGKGFNEFFPARVLPDSTPPPVFLTAFKMFNRPTPLDSSLETKTVITLAHNENDIGFEFVALSFHIPERNLYSYKLDGYDAAWSPPERERKASYTNLDAGEYTFRVRACNSDGVWNERGASIRIVITPPWWARWWARLGFGIVAIGMLYGAYHTRVQALERRTRRLEEQVQERTAALQYANNSLREMNDKLEDANEELQALSDEKDEFMGIAAHDLRSPIGGIRSLAELLERGQNFAPEKIQSIGGMIRKSGDTMLTLIGNLLNVNALERGAAQFSPETFDLVPLLDSIVTDYEVRAAAKNIMLILTPPESSINTRVYADRLACLQIFDNIVSNAVKYSPHGKRVWIETSSAEQSETQDMVRVSVQDEGAGFSAEDLQRLFGKFVRLSNEPTGGEQRTGLGLAIVKRLTEAQGGRVWCESERGRGARFVVELPCSLEA